MNLRSVLSVVGVRGVAVAMAAVNVVLIARLLGPAGRGVLAVFETISGLLVIAFAQWVSSFNSVRSAQEAAATRHLLVFSARWAATVGAALALLLVAAQPHLGVLGLAELDRAAMHAAMAAVPAQFFNIAALGLALGTRSQRVFNTLSLVQSNVYLPAIVVAGMLSSISLNTLLVTTAATHYALAVVSFTYFWRRSSGAPRSQATGIASSANMRFGGKLMLVNILSFLAMRSGIFVLQALRGPSDVGMFAIATRIGDLLMVVPSTVAAVLLGHMAAAPRETAREITRRFIGLLCMVVGGLAAIAALVAPTLIPAVFGPAFAPSYAPLVLLLPGLVFLTAELVMAQYLASLDMPRTMVAAWALAAAANLALNLWLVPVLGASGVALSATATYALLLGVVTAIYRRAA